MQLTSGFINTNVRTEIDFPFRHLGGGGRKQFLRYEFNK